MPWEFSAGRRLYSRFLQRTMVQRPLPGASPSSLIAIEAGRGPMATPNPGIGHGRPPIWGHLTIAIGDDGRSEITDALRAISAITVNGIAAHLYSSGRPISGMWPWPVASG